MRPSGDERDLPNHPPTAHLCACFTDEGRIIHATALSVNTVCIQSMQLTTLSTIDPLMKVGIEGDTALSSDNGILLSFEVLFEL